VGRKEVDAESLIAPAEEDVEADEEVVINEGEDVEVEPMKIAKDPGQPTRRQVEEHRKFHIPFRSWCKWCILGRGRGIQHRRTDGSRIAIVGLDYFFITAAGLKKREELEQPMTPEGEAEINELRKKGKLIKCILVRCFLTKIVFAHIVPYKGPGEDDFVADVLVKDIAWLGHTRMALKADGEPALQALVRRLLELVKVQCHDLEQLMKEDPATYDSRSNGGTEIGVQLIRGLFRTLKLCLEERIDKFIPVDHPVLAWLMQHTCLLLNTCVRGDDGLTAWARVRGRAFRQQLLGFGEAVLYKFPVKGPKHQPDGNMGTTGGEGIFVGYDRQSNTFMVETEAGPVRARSVTRRPELERWSAEGIARINSTPEDLVERPDRQRVRVDQPATEQGPTADDAQPAAIRRLRINKTDLDAYGYEDSCAQCRHILKYGKARHGGVHSGFCRTRLVEAMQQTDAGRARLAEQEERITRAMAEHLEHADQRAGAQERQSAAPEQQRPPRGLLERTSDGRNAGVPPPAAARVQGQADAPATEVSKAAPSASQPRTAQGESQIKASRGVGESQASSSGWLPVPGGEEAPMTPRGTPHEVTGKEGGTDAAIPEDGDTSMDDDGPGAGTGTRGDVEMDFVGHIDHGATDIGSLEPTAEDFISELLLNQMGGAGRQYRREARGAARKIVSEVYSPPRVTKLLKEQRSRHLMPGFAFDITVADPEDGTPWDFSRESKRRKARAMLREQRPYVLIGSPMCTHFCTWQALNAAKAQDVTAMRRARAAAIVHMNFVAELYQEQMQGDRYFLHEHPMWATSWELPNIEQILTRPDVTRVHGDQCQFGAEIQSGEHRGQPIKKPTGFMTNSPAIARALGVRCSGVKGLCSRPQGGAHQLCTGRHATEAAKYPRSLCKAILRGIRDQMREDSLLKDGCFGVQAPDEDAEVQKNTRGPAQGYSGQYRDDLTGQILKDALVKEARAKELEFFYTKNVWLKIPKREAQSRGGRQPISVRWVDVNKGDDINQKYRSRLVARQMKARDLSGQSYFAPAPPLEALRTVISLAMTRVGSHQPDWDPNSATRTQISLVDVKRAYFNAKVDPHEPPTFVQLPPEDPDATNMCARLLRHMYGTRLAADGWQEEYSTLLISLGFRQGDACPNVFYHGGRRIVTSVHGDDFTSSGPKSSLDWLEHTMAEHYELDIGPRLGPGPEDAKEGRVLNRVIRWCDSHIEYEADPRQVERLVAECGLEGAKGVATPGVKATFKKLEEEDADLPEHLTTAFRGSAARGNYLAADRLDVQFACKEVCRWMAHPTAHAWEALKRVCRYLNKSPRLVYEFRQQSVSHVDVYTDTDWAGCPKTRKSTSGGCVMLGGHAVKHWSSTQQSISLSSGEAEFAGVIRGAGQGLGYQALLHDLGVDLPLRVWTDSSAAIGICTRQGLGKLRHLDTHTLWIQQAVRTRRVDLRKVDGESNPADLLTKHSISRQRLEDLITLFGCRYLGGRAGSAPQMRRAESSRVTMADAERTTSATKSGNAEGLGAVREEEGAQDTCTMSPLMPHLVYGEADLNRLYPKFEAPDDEQLDDLQKDTDDRVYQHGLSVAAAISAETETQGRKRRPEVATAQVEDASQGGPGSQEESGGGENGKNWDSVRRQGGRRAAQQRKPGDSKQVGPPQESTNSSSLSRRRSAEWRLHPRHYRSHNQCARSSGLRIQRNQ